jgi:chemotaxis protein CheC
MQISPYQVDILKEVINIGVGRAAGILNQMLRYHIELQVPEVKILAHRELAGETGHMGRDALAAVEMGFSGPFTGASALVFSSESASRLVSILVDDPTTLDDLDLLRIGTLQEVGNIVLNGVMGSIANILSQPLDYSPPTFEEGRFDSLVLSRSSNPAATVLLAQTHFSIRQVLIEGDIVIIFDVGAFDVMLSYIDRMIPAQRHSGA